MAEGKLYKKITLKMEFVGTELSECDKMIINEALKAVNENVGKRYGMRIDRNVTYLEDNKCLIEVLYPILSEDDKRILVEVHDLKKQLSALLGDRY